MFRKILHRYRLSAVVKELPFYMGRDLRPKKQYSHQQIKRRFFHYRFHPNYFSYAIAILGTPIEFKKEFGENSLAHYQALRQEVADIYFDGNVQFTYLDLMRITRFKGKVSVPSDQGFNKYDDWSFGDGGGGDGGGGDG